MSLYDSQCTVSYVIIMAVAMNKALTTVAHDVQDGGYTALILASYRGFVEVLELLLKYKADVNIQNKVFISEIISLVV